MKTTEIEKAALKLTPKEKAALSLKLLESIDAERNTDTDKIWQREIDERYKQIIDGKVKIKDAEFVISEAKLKYK